MPGPLKFDAFLGWVNVTDPNNIPPDARVLSADDLLRYEKLGVDAKAKFAEVDAQLETLDSDTKVAEAITTPTSATRAAVQGMVTEGVEDFQAVIDAVPDQVEAQVPPLVSTALAADTTVAQAAATAVTNEIAGRDLVEGGEFIGTYNDSAIFSVVDEDGRRTWIEVAADGAPTQRSLDLLVPKVTPAITPQVEASIGVQAMSTPITELAFAVVDEDGRRTEIEVGADGRFTQRVVDSLRLRITGGPAISDAVICSGDSMTGGSSGTPYPAHLATLTGWNVVNMGVGGETSTTIAGRMGGRPMLATVANNAIPASGGVLVTLFSDDGISAPTPLLQQHAGVNPVQIAGVEGTLSVDDTTAPHIYTFTRTAAGDAVPVNYRTPIITRAMREYRSGIHVMWWGTNPEPGTAVDTNGSAVIARQRALIDHLTDANKRYLVMAPTVQTTAWRAQLTREYLAAYGRRFIDLGTYLSSPAAMEDAGLVATQADLDAQAIGKVPPALMKDSTHLNQSGDILVAKQVRNRIKEMGWK